MDVLLSFCVAILLVLLASWGVSVFAGNQYPEAVSLLRILAVWVFFGGITTYIGAPVLVSLGYLLNLLTSVCCYLHCLLLYFMEYVTFLICFQSTILYGHWSVQSL